jgi:hypothetical protein
MSQGMIIRNGLIEPTEMHVLADSYTCTCGDTFSLYRHKAHPESVEEQIAWLKTILDAEHTRNRHEHDNSYHCPW